jgi:hypothetical protein
MNTKSNAPTDKKLEKERTEAVVGATDEETGKANMDSHELAKNLGIDHVPGRSALDSVSDANAPHTEDKDRGKKKVKGEKDDGVGQDAADERAEHERGVDRILAEKGSGKNVNDDLSKAAQAKAAGDAAHVAPANLIGTVKMVRDEPMVPGGPTMADVHQEQIADFKAHGWRTV